MRISLLTATILTLSTTACVGQPDELDDVEDDATIGDYVDSAFEDAAAQACNVQYGNGTGAPLGTARVQVDYSLVGGVTKLKSVGYDISNREHLSGDNNKVQIDVQKSVDGRWKDAAGNGGPDYALSHLPLGGDTLQANTSVETGAHAVRLKVRVSWDIRLASDPASTCYMWLS